MKKIVYIFAMLAGMVSINSIADTVVYLGLKTHHTGLSKDLGLNEENELVMVKADNWLLGRMGQNSFHRESLFVAREFSKEFSIFDAGLGLGVVSGYKPEELYSQEIVDRLNLSSDPSILPSYYVFINAHVDIFNIRFSRFGNANTFSVGITI